MKNLSEQEPNIGQVKQRRKLTFVFGHHWRKRVQNIQLLSIIVFSDFSNPGKIYEYIKIQLYLKILSGTEYQKEEKKKEAVVRSYL